MVRFCPYCLSFWSERTYWTVQSNDADELSRLAILRVGPGRRVIVSDLMGLPDARFDILEKSLLGFSMRTVGPDDLHPVEIRIFVSPDGPAGKRYLFAGRLDHAPSVVCGATPIATPGGFVGVGLNLSPDDIDEGVRAMRNAAVSVRCDSALRAADRAGVDTTISDWREISSEKITRAVIERLEPSHGK